MWEQFDQGTQRAILRLHRSTDEPLLVSTTAGARSTLTQPALIVWGERDPWIAAAPYAEALRRPAAERPLARVPSRRPLAMA